MKITKVIKVGTQFEIQQGLCSVRHNVSCPFDDWKVSGITDAQLYRVLEKADEVLVLEGKGETGSERLLVTVGPLTFKVYLATL